MILIASINNFARLYSVTPTWAWEEITVAMEICDAWFGQTCNFEVRFDNNGGANSPFTLTNVPLNTYTGDVKLFYFTIPANTFAVSGQSSYMTSQGITAKATILGEGNSNELQMDLMYYDNFTIENIIPTVSSSIYKISMFHQGISSSPADGDKINSYQVKLYDSEMDLVYESEVLTDWNNYFSFNFPFTLRNLQNNTNYNVQVIGTLFNGFQVETPVYPFRVEYSNPVISSDLHLTNIETKGAIQISQTFNPSVTANKVKISRSVSNENQWVEIYNGTRSTSIMKYDYMGLYGVQYDYKLDLYQNDTFVAEYVNTITSKFQGMVLVDKYNHFGSLIKPSKDYDKVFNSVAIDTQGSKYTYIVSNGDTNHFEGNISCTVHEFDNDNCTLKFDNFALFRISFINFLTNKRCKLLKFDDGTAFLIGITGHPSCSEGEDETSELAKCSFNWSENGDATDITDYINNGLI